MGLVCNSLRAYTPNWNAARQKEKPDPLAGTRLFSAPKGWLSGDPVGSGVADFLADHGYPVLFGQ